ncbi:MAG: isochorismatase family cysteine hydrolase [Thermoplasmata archaeon]
MTEGIIVLDMINDFVYGELASDGARNIVSRLEKLLQEAEEKDIPIIFCRDSHSSSDPEIDIWGEHAMADDEGSHVIPELSVYRGVEIPKRFYDAFHDTDLYLVLRELSVDIVVLTGVSTDICVQHTAAGAFFRGFDIIVLDDCTASMNKDAHENALNYMKKMYGAKVLSLKELKKKWKKERGL